MNAKPNLGANVHIVPLGFEIDRVTKPLEKAAVNKVYLLTTLSSPNYEASMNLRQEHYYEAVKHILEKIPVEVELVEIELFNFLDVLKKVAQLIVSEQDKGNNVFINMSAGGTLAAVGATIAGMAHNATIYFVEATDYSKTFEEEKQHGLSKVEGTPKVTFLTNLPITLPDEMGKLTLEALYKKRMQREGDTEMEVDEILNLLLDNKMVPELFKDEKAIKDTEERRMQAQKNRIYLNKFVLGKLEESGYIDIRKAGRQNKIKITPNGEQIVYLIGKC